MESSIKQKSKTKNQDRTDTRDFLRATDQDVIQNFLYATFTKKR
jgi:hypothetical protein